MRKCGEFQKVKAINTVQPKKEKKMVYLDSSLTELEIENNDNLLSDTAERKGKSNAVLFFVGSKKDSGWIAGKMLYQARKTQKQAT